MTTDRDAAPVRPPIDRAAALAEGAPKVPRRAIVIGVAVAAALALGGTALERAASSAGLNPRSTAQSTTTTTTTTLLTATRPIGASIASLLGVVRLAGRRAPDISLHDQDGATVTLASRRGTAVVITFFDASCVDACHVLAAEIRHANADLGADRARVTFLTVNTDPLETARTPLPPAVTATGLATLPNWHFLTGSLARVDQVWRRYGVTVDVYPTTGRVTHNDVMYFVDPSGRLRIRAAPVADEDRDGRFSLPAAEVRRTGAGIASYAATLLGTRR